MFEKYKSNLNYSEYGNELTDDEIIQILDRLPNKIRQPYFQYRILNILNQNTFINNNTNRNNITNTSSIFIRQ